MKKKILLSRIPVDFSLAQSIFTLSHSHDTLEFPSDSSWREQSWVNIYLVTRNTWLLRIVFYPELIGSRNALQRHWKYLCKNPSIISKEVKKRRRSDWYYKGSFNNANNFCVHRYHCKKTNVCKKISVCGVKCASCLTCNQTCRDFKKEQCQRLDKAPYVCNGCIKPKHKCTIAQKYIYNAKVADRTYRSTLTNSRTGLNMTKHELHATDKIVSPLIAQGQSPYQIIANHPELDMSVRTL